MYSLIFYSVSEGISIDSRTNQATVFSILEQINAGALPIILSKVAIYIVIAREATDLPDFTGTLIMTLGEAQLVSQKVVCNFKDQLKGRMVIDLYGIPLTTFGKLQIKLFDDQRLLGTKEVDVLQAPAITKRIMIRCPVTGKPVPTGMNVDINSFKSLEFPRNTFSPCPACGQSNSWEKKDAFLEPDEKVS